jgi:hypothetical protein
MLDDPELDQLLAEVNPEPVLPDEIDEAWARFLCSQPRTHLARPRPHPRVLVPVLGACAAAVAFGVVNWLPAGAPESLTAAYAQRITKAEEALSVSTGRVLYVKTEWTSTGTFGTRHFVDQYWVGDHAYRDSGVASGPGTRNTVTDVGILGGVGAYYVPATNTLHVDRSNVPGASLTTEGLQPGSDPLGTALLAVVNAKAGKSASASNVAGAFRDLTRLPGAKVTRHSGLETASVTNGRYESTMTVHTGDLRPVLIKLSAPQPGHFSTEYHNTIHFIHYGYLPASEGARQVDLLDVYPHAKIVTTHKPTLHVP